jgi:hypothetical protein
MPENSFKTMMVAFVLFALFGMMIITAVISIGGDYSMDTSEVTGGSLSLDKFNQSISNIENDAKSLQIAFNSGSIWSTIAGVVVEGIFGIAIDMIKLILAPFDLLSDILSDTLNIPSFVSSVILGLLIFSIIFAIWRLIKIGD